MINLDKKNKRETRAVNARHNTFLFTFRRLLGSDFLAHIRIPDAKRTIGTSGISQASIVDKASRFNQLEARNNFANLPGSGVPPGYGLVSACGNKSVLFW